MKKETINIDHRKKIFKAQLNGVGFKEGDAHIIYLPSLQISSYGECIEEANEMMKISLNEFSENLLQLDELKINSILKQLGWEKAKFFDKRLVHLSETTFEDIKKEFNLPDDTQVQKIPIAV
ncbi:hypothetical protein ESY86_05030 [Subsaximicrobium wynnwilliamsii]|uniref:Uncharacterized protein n=1 Tax=Subsaximicrobium wynnwilliamsii TaxID=291179 RepID=A0A5C6ZIU6_9FLAO|nr:hypothetical protein [Subsaximicrobium wynnwilliamsii]TXD84433.1 hypothetical protein ESY87_04810 [Subsaximicrobium wynnwilliamsii]TXD90114.1 hypothetical protein ESY86_05030 [Subsaximicrobium wynnwilliamsii]TXE04166.1 hypothetical protein ESY88_04805 [Subsaximicrobium wynnwilliamsii]